MSPSNGSAETKASESPARACGPCTLCCTVLRVDELGKLGGVSCRHEREGRGCAIHPERPQICRDYRCLWLRGGLDDEDRPDRLGAVVDIVPHGITGRLGIQEASPGAYDGSPRLQAIAARYRESMPVRIVLAGNFLDADRPFRVLLPGGEEQRVRGEEIEIYQDGHKLEKRRIPWLDRWVRRAGVLLRRRKLRRAAERSELP